MCTLQRLGTAAAALSLTLYLGCGPRDPSRIDDDEDGFTADVDCDDSDPAVRPGVTETPYDGVDNDCDPETRDDDLDQDGFDGAFDCDDGDAAVSPTAPETPYDGIDNDCAPETPDDDLDGDGFPLAADCADMNPDIHPGQAEVYYDGVDNDCDFDTDDQDQDGDGSPVDVDCDDTDATVGDPPVWHVDCDLDGYAASVDGAVAACVLPAAPSACPGGSWTLRVPDGPAHDAANDSVDCADGDPLAFPGQTQFAVNPALGIDSAWPYDYDCNGQQEPRYGDYTCSTTSGCAHSPGFVAATACGEDGDHGSGCATIAGGACEPATTETRTQECR